MTPSTVVSNGSSDVWFKLQHIYSASVYHRNGPHVYGIVFISFYSHGWSNSVQHDDDDDDDDELTTVYCFIVIEYWLSDLEAEQNNRTHCLKSGCGKPRKPVPRWVIRDAENWLMNRTIHSFPIWSWKGSSIKVFLGTRYASGRDWYQFEQSFSKQKHLQTFQRKDIFVTLFWTKIGENSPFAWTIHVGLL